MELCSFAVCELRDGRSTRDPQDRYRAKDDSLIIILTMLGTLAVKLSPSCLHLGGSIGSEHTPAPGMITEGQLASSSNSRSNKRIPIVPGSGWSARLGIGNSNKSVAAFEANLIPPSALAEQGAGSVIAAVLPVLGAVLSDEGDILAPRTWSPGVAASRHGNVHCAAWRALCVFTTHLCSASMSVRLSERDAISSLGRSTSSNSAEHASKHIAITGGIQQWWQIVQILLSVLFNELTRAQKRLKIVVRRREAEEAVMIATRARLLTAGQVPAPLPAVSGISHLFRQETSAAFAITFWVWAPESAPRAANGGEQSPNAEARMVICTCVQKDWCGGGGGAESQVVLSKLLPSKQRQENANNRHDDERVYVEFAFLKHDNGDASLPTAGRAGDEEGIRLPPGGAVFEESTDRSTETLVVKKFMSGCPLPVGHWTHVCCSYSENEKEIHSRERGGRTQRPCLPVVRISFDGRVVFEQDLPDCNINLRKYQNQGSPGEPAHFEVQVGERNRHLENPPGEMRTGLNVYDIYWHGREISPEQVHILASNGTSQQQDNEQRLAECYVDRLVTLALEIALSSQRAATAMSSSRWLNLWIMTIPVSSLQTQRVVLQALSLLLCTDHLTCGDKTQDANLNSGANADSSFLCPGAPACELDDRVVIDRLCSLLGRSLLSLRDRNLGDYVSRRQNELGKIVIAQERSKEHLSTPQRTRHITIAPRASQESSLISAIVSLLRLLMLEAPTRWRRHVHAALVSGLGAVNAETLVALSNSIPALKTSSTEWYPADGRIETGSLSAARLGAAAAAVYLGGGHIEGPHVGARVSLLPNGYPFVGCFNAADAPVSGAPVGADTLGQGSSTNSSMAMDIVSIGYTSVKCVCGGTLLGVEDLDAPNTGYLGALAVVTVDEEYLGCVDSELDRNTSEAHQSWKRSVSGGKHVQSTMPRRRVIAVDRRQVVWTADVAEPKTPFLFEDAAALSTVSTLLESSCSGRNTCADESIGQPGASRGDAADPSWVNIITAHLQSRLVRALAVQLRHSDLAANAVLGDFLNPLLKLASMPLQSAPTLALGVNGAVAFRRRREFAAVILSFDRQRSSGSSSSRSLLADLEAACQAVWARMSTSTGDPAWSLVPSREGFRACTSNERGVQRSADNGDRSSSSLRPVLQVLGGEAQVDGDRVTAASHFPTVRLSGVGAGLRSAAGRWYYEVTLHTGGLMQLGWAAPPFYCSPVRGQGVGDHVHSWAFDGFRQKRWCVSSAAYGKRWRAGDVVGVLLDAGLQEMRFRYDQLDTATMFSFKLQSRVSVCSVVGMVSVHSHPTSYRPCNLYLGFRQSQRSRSRGCVRRVRSRGTVSCGFHERRTGSGV